MANGTVYLLSFQSAYDFEINPDSKSGTWIGECPLKDYLEEISSLGRFQPRVFSSFDAASSELFEVLLASLQNNLIGCLYSDEKKKTKSLSWR